MEALVLHNIGDLRLEQIPIPEPRAGEVRIRVAFCGVCGSDISRIFVSGTYNFPTVCGHEFSGTVDACGPGVDDFAPGDNVVVFPLLWCKNCPECKQQNYVRCHNYDYLGSRSNGAFAEYVVAPQENLIALPGGISLEEAAMTEPAAVALHALRRSQTTSGRFQTLSFTEKTVVIFGAGTIGLITAQWSRILGATTVLLFEVVLEKVELAEQLGFEKVFNPEAEDPAEVINAHTDGQGAHVCIEAAGAPSAYLGVLGSVARGGSVVLLGNPTKEVPLTVPLISRLMRHEAHIFGAWNSYYSTFNKNDDWRTVLQAMESGILTLTPLITHKVPLAEGCALLNKIQNRTEFYAKVLIHPSAEPQPSDRVPLEG